MCVPHCVICVGRLFRCCMFVTWVAFAWSAVRLPSCHSKASPTNDHPIFLSFAQSRFFIREAENGTSGSVNVCWRWQPKAFCFSFQCHNVEHRNCSDKHTSKCIVCLISLLYNYTHMFGVMRVLWVLSGTTIWPTYLFLYLLLSSEYVIRNRNVWF